MHANYGRILISLKSTALIDDTEIELIRHPQTAGIVLFSRNHQNREQLAKLLADIQVIAITSGKSHGLPIFVDQEGGAVQRFKSGFQLLPALQEFGRVFNLSSEIGLKYAFEMGQLMASELTFFGITSLAPVIDLDCGNKAISNYGRSMHRDPQFCAQIAESYILGMFAGGMRATLKHFPGHGQDIGDSHEIQPQDPRELIDIQMQDLYPYEYLLEKIPHAIGAVMPAHIKYTAIDPDNIASLSHIWINKLRQYYKFSGIVVSDCVSMRGAGQDPIINKLKQALQVCDIAILCNMEPKIILENLNQLEQTYTMTSEIMDKMVQWVNFDNLTSVLKSDNFKHLSLNQNYAQNSELLINSNSII